MKKIFTFKIEDLNKISEKNIYLTDQWDSLDVLNKNSNDFDVNNYWCCKENYYNTAKYMSVVQKKFINNLSKYLNKYHKENKGEKYWGTLSGEWAFYFLWQLFNQWELLKGKKDYIFMLKNVKENLRAPICIDKHDFSNVDWNQLLFKDIFDSMDKNNYEIINYEHISSSVSYQKKKFFYLKLKHIIKKIKYLICKRIKETYKDVILITNDLAGYFEIEINTIKDLPFKATVLEYDAFTSIDVSKKKRVKIFRPSIEYSADLDKFESVLYKIAHKYIPISLMEHRCKYLKKIKKLINLGLPKAICSSGIDYSDCWSYYLAELKEKNVPTYRYQHGGNYGIEKKFPFLSWEFERYDNILSWGNCYVNNSISSFYRKVLSKKNSEKEIDILIVAYEPLLYRLGYNGMPLVVNPNIYEKQINDVIKLLINNNLSNIIYKTRDYGDGEYGISKRLFENFPEIKIDKCTNAVKLIKKSKFVIVTYLSTSFFECLYENTPAVLYLNKYKDIIEEDIQPLFKEMELAGLVHWDSQSLDKFISSNKDKIKEWWESDDLEFIKKKVIGLLAKPSSNPFYDVLNIVYKHSQSIHSD